MPLADLQAGSQTIGQIKIGRKVLAQSGKAIPQRLDTFRFTTRSGHVAEAAAALFGGTVAPWDPDDYEGTGDQPGRRTAFQVITEVKELAVMVPPRALVVDQWYEMYSRGGLQRKCDSRREQLSGGDCLCPHADDPTDAEAVREAARERARLAKLNPPQACGNKTHISVALPDLPGFGVFQLTTGSYFAAIEIQDQAMLLEMARQQGVHLRAILRIDQRKKVENGKTTPYPVIVLEILDTMRDIITGQLAAGGIAAQLPPPPAPRKAIGAGAPARPALPSAAAPHDGPPPDEPTELDPADLGDGGVEDRLAVAQDIANAAARATTANQMKALVLRAKADGIEDDEVLDGEGVRDTLIEVLRDRWRVLAAQDRAAAAGASAASCGPHPPAPGDDDLCTDCGQDMGAAIHAPVPGGG